MAARTPAAAKYIAARIGAPVPLRVPLYYYSVDLNVVALVPGEYDIYLVKDEPELANAFVDAMQSYCATRLLHDLPQPYEKSRAVVLPHTEAKSVRVSEIFREAGFVQLGQHLKDVARSSMPESPAAAPAQPGPGRERGRRNRRGREQRPADVISTASNVSDRSQFGTNTYRRR